MMRSSVVSSFDKLTVANNAVICVPTLKGKKVYPWHMPSCTALQSGAGGEEKGKGQTNEVILCGMYIYRAICSTWGLMSPS